MRRYHVARVVAPLVFAAAVGIALSYVPANADETAGSEQTRTYKLGVEGMGCPINCAPRVKEALESIDGVSVVTVDFDSKTAFVTVGPGKKLTTSECDAAFGNQGYFVSSLEEQADAKPGS